MASRFTLKKSKKRKKHESPFEIIKLFFLEKIFLYTKNLGKTTKDLTNLLIFFKEYFKIVSIVNNTFKNKR
jgi:hypothetical protein